MRRLQACRLLLSSKFQRIQKLQEMFEQRSGNELSLAASNGDFEKVRELILADTGK